MERREGAAAPSAVCQPAHVKSGFSLLLQTVCTFYLGDLLDCDHETSNSARSRSPGYLNVLQDFEVASSQADRDTESRTFHETTH